MGDTTDTILRLLPELDGFEGIRRLENGFVFEQIGKGGMGVVWAAWDFDLAKMVAVKFSPPPLSEDFELRFKAEARRLAEIEDRNVVRIIRHGKYCEVPYIVMEYLSGETVDKQLERRLKQGGFDRGRESLPAGQESDSVAKTANRVGPFSLEECVFLGSESARALAAVHKKKCIHRDVKPGNIFVTTDCEVKLVDFGIAKKLGEGITSNRSRTPFTRPYASPEQKRGLELGPETDIYSLGKTIVHLYLGQPNEDFEVTDAAPDSDEEQMYRILKMCLQSSPDRRYRNGHELLAEFDSLNKSLAGADTIDEERFQIARIEAPPEEERKRIRAIIERQDRETLLPQDRTEVDRESVRVGGNEIRLIRVPGGIFPMGSPDGEGKPDEQPVHEVQISPFLLAENPVTQGVWKAVMGENPSRFLGATRPVESVSWRECKLFCSRLNALGLRDWHFRLPREAEWEYACWLGWKSSGPPGLFEAIEAKNANCDHRFTDRGERLRYVGETIPVDKYDSSHPWGFQHLLGNVWEWCEDTYVTNAYGQRAGKACSDPCPSTGTERVLRGGSWTSLPWSCRPTNRFRADPESRWPFIGFRLVATEREQSASDR